MDFEQVIRHDIHHHGPMSVETFMRRVTAHYYSHRQVFGRGGDFTTAPEISQIFGELLGAWTADCWIQMGRPDSCYLIECGPGRGTLMADALRATKHVPGFHHAIQIHLIETSQSLQEKQREALKDYPVFWHDHFEMIPTQNPLILLANEFLDALPVRQFQCAQGQWQERVIGLDNNGKLQWGLIPANAVTCADIVAKDGDNVEISPEQHSFIREVCTRLKHQGGMTLFIDYGYIEGHGDTLQAVKSHEYVPVFEGVGQADITAHVDFSALSHVAEAENCAVFPIMTQNVFLTSLGIHQRASFLKKKATRQQTADIDSAVHRLTASDEMGELFKVMMISGKVQEG